MYHIVFQWRLVLGTDQPSNLSFRQKPAKSRQCFSARNQRI